ncbi:MAG TPA: DNA mismatch repair endonuclease MutL [Planctomycetes bacterium]|nr:DNA mismatch repair endonuclease MutL [Planctomycetota bacterium]HIK61049.1 DNA mismatch repair endonuclease MutL [Planctomycetota bacterium]
MPQQTPPARIALLPEVVRNQIAAGEVIERPASVVKELVENALDAGASEVRVDLEEGGVKLVRVIDNGCGMGAEDLAMAFHAHATSKLQTPEDLDHIASLGFRGEALASMGSVARCTILSRPQEQSTGATVQNVGGKLSEVREAGGAVGTSTEVRDLFFNTPARRRFLKRTSTELSRCLDVIQRAALAHVGVGFVVTHGGKRVFDVEADMDLLARIRRTFGAELAESLVPVEAADGMTHLLGYVAPPRFSRRDTARQMWFLNGRAMRDKVLTRVLRDSYRGFLEEGRQPVAFLQLSIEPAQVDVNVHPAKTEVRLRDSRRLFGFLVHHLREAVRQTDMSTPGESMLLSMQRRENREDPAQAALPNPGPLAAGLQAAPQPGFEVHEVAGRTLSDVIPSQAPATPLDLEEGRKQWTEGDDLRGPFLQIARTYLVRALPDGFEIIDQHALHERTTFEELRQDVRENKVEVQKYLVPELVELSRADVELLSGHMESLTPVGLELAVFGPSTVAVHGLPARLRNPDVEGVVRDLVDVLGRTGKAPGAEDVIEEVLHSSACRSSVMAGDSLTEDEIRSLLLRASALETDQTCPHSRPTKVRFKLPDLERAFHRR